MRTTSRISRRWTALVGLCAIAAGAACAAPGPAGDDSAAEGAGANPDAAASADGREARPSGPLTFSRDIAPVVFENCAPCHRPGRPGPFSLLSYRDVSRRGELIRAVTESRYMPPWLPEPGHGEFFGNRRLDDRDIEAILAWVAEGMIEGDPDEMPALPEISEGWQLGVPDLVLPMTTAYTLAPGGDDVFRNFVIPATLQRRRYIRSVELRPGNARIVHHALITIDQTGSSRRLEALDPEPGYYVAMDLFSEAQNPDGHFIGWTPGKVAVEGREDIAWELRPGTDLVLQLHMLPQPQPEEIQAEIGLYFADRPPRRQSFVVRLGPFDIDIPAGAPDYTIEESYELPVDVEAFAVYPHAHYLGKEMKGYATLPDGTVEWLVWIRDWDFMQQDWYLFEEPVELPAGTKLTMQFTYDNTADNPRNPNDPPQRVVWGPESSDEMGDLWIQVLLDEPGDLTVLQDDFLLKEVRADLDGTRRALQENPQSAGDHYNLARLLTAVGDIDEAISQYRESLRLDAANHAAHLNLANLLASRQLIAEAVGHYNASLQIEPTAAAYGGLGLAALQQGAAVEAEAFLRRALSLDAYSWQAHNSLGNALAAQGRLEEAVLSYRRSIEISPEIAEIHNNLGGALGQLGRPGEAADEFRIVLMLQPEHAEAHNNLGLSLERQGDREQAILHYREALRIRPDYERARINLDRALAGRG